MHNEQHTPLMRQYHEIRQHYPDTLLLFQVGDFYEMLFDDAKTASSFLGIALTSRGKHNGEPIPLCGVPLHALDHYLTKLVKGGFKVAICDQLEEPKPGTVVKRGVTRVLTPGTLTEAQLLEEKNASYLFSFFPTEKEWGLIFGELLTGQLFATIVPADKMRMVEAELARFFPDEILIPQTSLGKKWSTRFSKLGYFTTPLSYDFNSDQEKVIEEWIAHQFKPAVHSVLHEHEAVRLALYYFYAYVQRNQPDAVSHFSSLHFYKPDDFLMLDAATQRNLELVTNAHDGSHRNTLFAVLDRACTAMGSRMIKKWLLRPLLEKTAIEQRYDVISLFISQGMLTYALHDQLSGVGDLERTIGRIALKRAPLHDYLALMNALRTIPEIKKLLLPFTTHTLLSVIVHHLGDFHELYAFLHAACNDDPSKDWIIKEHFNSKLDELRSLAHHSNIKILELEAYEQQRTGISSLKIRYNRVHGYYIEVTKANLDAIPADYVRQQTLVGRERFITPSLQAMHVEIATAQERLNALEAELFEQVKQRVYSYVSHLRKLAHALAHLDALVGFAQVASTQGYVRPQLTATQDIAITQGRHPVVESVMEARFVPNDTRMNAEQRFFIITGPNMGGKSTYLRQVALIAIMAQCGSFVPAKAAELPLFDRIFTRIGAGDNVAEGKSTFLVEMEETAAICTQATVRSLVILDEVGRGTSTFDGLAIAHAVIEYLYKNVGASCLFATHYHELTSLGHDNPGIKSFYAQSAKTTQGITFLYTIQPGIADGSFGIEVAKLAGIPSSIIERSQRLLEHFKQGNSFYQGASLVVAGESKSGDLSLQEHAVVARLRQLDINELSPKQAFDLIWQLKESL